MQTASKIGLKINTNKTKVMELLKNRNNTDTRFLTFKKINEFRYLRHVLNTKNDWISEIGEIIIKAERASFSLKKFLSSNIFSNNIQSQVIYYSNKTYAYGCEALTITSITERKLKTFENKIWRTICRPVYDNKKTNNLTENCKKKW